MSFDKPNYTQTPNKFYDDMLKEIDSMAELKVTLAVIRHTMGFHRDEHELSLTYLVEYTGLHRETVIEGLKAAMKRGTVTRRKSGNTYAYSMKVVGNSDQQEIASGREIRPEDGREIRPKKEREKEKSTDSAKIAKNGDRETDRSETQQLMDEIYWAIKDRKMRLTKDEYAFNLGRIRNVLSNDDPTGEELDELPKACVEYFEWYGTLDVAKALRRYRQQQHRREREQESAQKSAQKSADKPAPWEPVNPNSDESIAAKDKPRKPEWYMSFFDVVPEHASEVIKNGRTHSQIMEELKMLTDIRW